MPGFRGRFRELFRPGQLAVSLKFQQSRRLVGESMRQNASRIITGCRQPDLGEGANVSLQAIAGVAYDRRHPQSPTRVARLQMATAQVSPAAPEPQNVATAKQFNSALEALKRFIPTEFLALYVPFLAMAKDRAKDAPDLSQWIYLGFMVATPFAVALIYLAKAAESNSDTPRGPLPIFEMLLATIAFAIWGANVPGIFPGNHWWLPIAAAGGAFALPLIDSAFGNRAAGQKKGK